MQDRMDRGAPRSGRTFVRAAALVAALVAGACSSAVRDGAGPASSLAVTNTSLLRVHGPFGGPFPDGHRGYTLTNTTAYELGWTAYSAAHWLDFSVARGSLAPGESAEVVVAIDQERAAALPPGTYDAQISFRGDGDGLAEVIARFELDVRAPSAGISIHPAEGLAVTLDPGAGPQPDSRSFVLENSGDLELAWQAGVVSQSGDWLYLNGPSAGALPPGAQATLVLAVDSFVAQGLSDGVHFAQVAISDDEGAALGAIPVTMQVGSESGGSGWTAFEPAQDARIVYVSSSTGNDQNDGFSEATPKASIAAGKILIRHGMPDWLLLKAGDVFAERIGQWKTSGRSATEPQLISSYSPAGIGLGERPRLRTGNSSALDTSGGGGSPSRIEHVAVVGLHFTADGFVGPGGDPSGVGILQPVSDFLIEDCKFEGYSTGLVIQGFGGRHADFRLRRCVVVDSNDTEGGNPQGIYIENTDGVLLEENVFDTNGWDPADPAAPADIFSHNVYIDTHNSDVVLRGNLIVNGASHGVQMRSGGLAEENVFVRNSIALMMGGREGPEQNPAIARNNVILDGKDIDDDNHRGWGIDFNNIVSGEIRGNIIANNVSGRFPIPILLDGDGYGHWVRDVEVEGNIVHDWGGSILFQGDATRLSGITFKNNIVENKVDDDVLVQQTHVDSTQQIDSANNRFFSAQCSSSSQMRIASAELSIGSWRTQMGDQGSSEEAVPSTGDMRTVAGYHASLGRTATHDAFMAEARRQSRSNWREEYTARALAQWIRAGFQ